MLLARPGRAPEGAAFDPKGSVSRLAAARSLLTLLAGRVAAAATPAAPGHQPGPAPLPAPTQPAPRGISR